MSKKRKDEITRGRVYKRRRRDPKNPERVIESKYWWIEYYHHRKIRQPTKTESYSEAVRLLNKELERAAAGKVLPLEAERMKFSDLVRLVTRDYTRNKRRSLDRVERAFGHLSGYFGMTRPADIDFQMIDSYIEYRENADKAANATIKYELAILKKGFGMARNILPRMPDFPSITTANIRTGFFEEEDFQAFLPHFPEDLKPVLIFSYLTGWRMQSEVFPLRWTQVDFSAGEVRLEPGSTKNGEGRTFPFALLPQLRDLLTAQKAKTDEICRERGTIIPWVFHRQGRPIESIRKVWQTAIKNSKIGHKIPHDFRRTAVRRLERAGVPRSVAMKLVGHKTEAIYQRYAIVAKNDLTDGTVRLAEYMEKLKNTEKKVVPIRAPEEEKISNVV